jgi:hypothetical protein
MHTKALFADQTSHISYGVPSPSFGGSPLPRHMAIRSFNTNSMQDIMMSQKAMRLKLGVSSRPREITERRQVGDLEDMLNIPPPRWYDDDDV